MKILFFIFLCWGVLHPQKIAAQIHRAKQITTRNGLLNNTINIIFEDKNGFVWIGTERGILRYDGYHFEDLNDWNIDFDIYSLSIKCILETSSGRIIAGTEKGLIILDPLYKKAIFSPLHTSCNYLYLDRWGSLYALLGSDHKLNRLKPRTEWFYERDNSFLLQETSIGSFFGHPAIAQHDQCIWMANNKGELISYNPFKKSSRKHQQKGLKNNKVNCLLTDRNDNLWLGTDLGLYKYLDDDKFELHQGDPNPTDEVSSEKTVSLFEDRTGRLWVSRENQLVTYNPKEKKWQRKWFFQNDVRSGDPIFPSLSKELGAKPCFNIPCKILLVTAFGPLALLIIRYILKNLHVMN